MNDQSRSEFVTHNEFSAFERQVNRRFDEQTTILASLSAKMDQLSNRGTDWKAVFGGLSLAATVVLAIGGLFGWGLANRIDSIDSIVAQNRDELVATAIDSAGRNSAQDFQIGANNSRVARLEAKSDQALDEIAKRTAIIEIVRHLDEAVPALEERLRAIETTRNTAADRAALEARLSLLEAFRSEYSRLMDDMQQELFRRDPHVFGNGESP